MALDYLTLAHKPRTKLKDKDGNTVECLDLLPNTCEANFSDFANGSKCIVNKYYVARPDLISLAFYGTDKYADIICKVNGISNPFELNEDDLLDIPPVETVRYYSTAGTASELLSESSSVSQSHTSKQKSLDKKRSPAEQVAGDKNYVIDRTIGLIFY